MDTHGTGPAPGTPVLGHRTGGRGPCRVLFLHGWMTDSSGWEPLLPHLDADRFSWCLADAPGYGRSRSLTPWSVDGYAAAVPALMDHLGWDRCAVVGHSMSGVAAALVLTAVPDRVTALIGVAAVPPTGGGLTGERLDLFRRAAADTDVRETVIARSTGDRHPRGWARALAGCADDVVADGALDSYLTSWATRDDGARAAVAPSARVGLVVGAHDPSLNADRMRETWVGPFPGAELVVVEGAGHYPATEQPAALARCLGGLLAPR